MAMKGITVRALSALLTLAAVCAAKADYLYCMIDGTSLELDGTDGVFGDYAYARVKDVQSGTWLSVYDAAGSKTAATAVDKTTATGGPMLWGDFDADSSSSERTFLFELYNNARDVVAWQTVSYSYLMDQHNIGNNFSPAFTPYVLTRVVPEPTGGTLVLLGAAALALRRRRECA